MIADVQPLFGRVSLMISESTARNRSESQGARLRQSIETHVMTINSTTY